MKLFKTMMLTCLLALLATGYATAADPLYGIGINCRAKKVGQFKKVTSRRWDASWDMKDGKVSFDAAAKTWTVRLGDKDYVKAIPSYDRTVEIEPGRKITGIEFGRSTGVTVNLSDGSTITTRVYLAARPIILADGRCVVVLAEFKRTGSNWKKLWTKCYAVN
jgi:hypothetical protein